MGGQTLNEGTKGSFLSRGVTLSTASFLLALALAQSCNRRDEEKTEERTSCLSVYLEDAGMKGSLSDPLKSGLGSHVPSAVETEESERASFHSVQWVSLAPSSLSSPRWRGGQLTSLLSSALICPARFLFRRTPFPCLSPSLSRLFWVPGFVEMLCRHSNQLALWLPLPEPEMAWG